MTLRRRRVRTDQLRGREAARTSAHHVFVVPREHLELNVELHYVLDATDTWDDTVTLRTDDEEAPAYEQTHVLGESNNVEELADGYLRVTFTDILPGRSYSLEIDPGAGPGGQPEDPYLLFVGAVLPREEGRNPLIRDSLFEAAVPLLPDDVPEPEDEENLSEDEMTWLIAPSIEPEAEDEDEAS